MRKHSKMTALLLAVALVVTMFAGCSGKEAAQTEALAESTGTTGNSGTAGTVELVYGIKNGWNTLFTYGANTTNAWMLQDVLFEPLFKPGNGELYMRAAESVDFSEDFMSCTIHLRDGLTWHDGEPCTAADWVWTMQTVTNPEFGVYEGVTMLNIIAGTNDIGQQVEGEELGILYVDDSTFVLSFKQRQSIDALAGNFVYNYRALPKHLLEQYAVSEIATCDFWTNIVGNGCCIYVDEPVIGSELQLTANKNFYLGAPEFDKLTYISINDSNASNAFLNGEIDLYNSTLNSDILAQLDGVNGLHVELDTSTRSIWHMYTNNETLNDQVRKALDMLIDKDLLVEAIVGGDGIPQGDNVLTYLDCYLPYEHTVDVEGAKALLEEGGFDFSRVLKIGCSSARTQTAIMIQQFWAAAGVQTEIVTGEQTTLLGMQRDGEIEFIIGGWAEKYDPCSQVSNLEPATAIYNHITDTVYQEVGEKVHFASDAAEKLAAQHEWQLLLREKCPMIFLYSTPGYMTLSSKIVGGTLSGMMDMPWLWDIAGVD